MKAVAYRVDGEGNSKPEATVTFDGKAVTFEGPEGLVNFLQRVEFGDKVWTPKDGKAYMEALGKAFKGSRFFVDLEE